MGTSVSEIHILDPTIFRPHPIYQKPTQKCDIYPDMEPEYMNPTRHNKEQEKIGYKLVR